VKLGSPELLSLSPAVPAFPRFASEAALIDDLCRQALQKAWLYIESSDWLSNSIPFPRPYAW